MSKQGMAVPGNPMARIVTKIRGLELTQRAFAEIIYAKPTLTFELQGQFVIEGERLIVDYEIDFKVDPAKLDPAKMALVQAVRDRLQTAQRVLEQLTARSGVGGKSERYQVQMADLPDADMLVQLYAELDDAQDELLIGACVIDEFGKTAWGYVDTNGEQVNLTKSLLRKDLRMAQAIQKAFNAWLFSTSRSAGETSLTSAGNGTRDSTEKTGNLLSTGLPTNSSVPARTETILTEATYPPGTPQSSYPSEMVAPASG